ncbi:MAG: hypothetical protein OXE50_16565 [Chloroflexi bacterium]|nr:hypothetical protein [Chloroflexota bacterium]
MQDDKVLEGIQSDYRELAKSMTQLTAAVAGMGAQLKKLDDIDASIKELTEQDKLLHTRVSEKTDEINELSQRVTKVETKLSNNRLWIVSIAAVIGAIGAVGAFLLMFR